MKPNDKKENEVLKEAVELDTDELNEVAGGGPTSLGGVRSLGKAQSLGKAKDLPNPLGKKKNAIN